MKTQEYDVLSRVEEGHWWYRALRRVIFANLDRYLTDWQDKPILDAGCGTGGNLSRLGQNSQTVGIDYSPDALRFCRRRGLMNLVRADVSAIPLHDRSFDAVLSTHVLYHAWVKDVSRPLDEFHRVLRERGMLFLELPAYDSLYSTHDDAVMTARRFTAGRLRPLLEAAGFRIVRLSYWNSLLLPPIWLARRVLPSKKSESDFNDGTLPAWPVNAALDLAMRFEHGLSRVVNLPAGVTLSCVAQRV
ncbi:MAG: class I SAM-dependent methyltransferase [Pirellulales bacterium]|nr:class I SAM-dependent methyltransferase [Pirellulales bacterium]